MSETAILARVRMALSKAGAVIWRNNVGMLWDANKRPVRFGLCEGSSDLIGYRSLLVTPEMVGRRVAVFLACEVKTEDGRATSAQRHFLETVEMAGGIAILARSPEEATACLAPAALSESIRTDRR